MSADPIRAIADAVLYEGYILWPYRRSALKNQRRFTFGGVFPPTHWEAHPDDPARIQAEVLVRGGPDVRIDVTVRCLHMVHRALMRRHGDRLEEVDELIVDGERHLAWEEAAEREIAGGGTLEELRTKLRVPVTIDAGCRREAIGGAGAFVRSWASLSARLTLRTIKLERGLWRLSAAVANTTAVRPSSREEALAHALCSTHLLLESGAGEFVSLTDPPPELSAATAACTNIGTWPVLVGERGECHKVLASPIILEEYPRVAPESPGDLFDGGEIDQLLILNILALTDEERAEMAASDPRAKEILERCDALTPEQLMSLHGAIREFGMAR